MSPYGVKNETPKKTAWMEKCVASVMKNNPKMSEGSAIAVCKTQLAKQTKAELSLRTLEDMLGRKIREASGDEYVWIADIFPEYFVVELQSGFYKIGYSVVDNTPVISSDRIVRVDKYVEYREVDVENTYSGTKTFGNKSI